MHRLFEKLKPAFFKAWDQRLLINRPALWATKFHYALVFGLMGLGLSSLVVWFLPVELTAVPNAWFHLLYAAIPSAIGLAIWIWQVSLFKTDKAFGEAGLKMALRDQMIYAVVVFLAFGLPILHGYRVSEKVAHSLDAHQLVADLNHLNVLEGFTTDLPYSDENYSPIQRYEYHYFHRYTIYYNDDERLNSSEQNKAWFFQLNEVEFKAKLLLDIERYIHLIRKYSTTPFALEPNKIYQEYMRREESRGSSLVLPSAFKDAEHEAEKNLRKLQDAKAGVSDLLHNQAWQGPAVLALWVLGLLLIGLQSNIRSLIWSVVVAGTLVIVGVFTSVFLSFNWALRQSEWLPLLHIVATIILGCWLMMKRKTSPKGVLIKQVLLSVWIASLAFIPLSIWEVGQMLEFRFDAWEREVFDYGSGLWEFAIMGGAALPFVLWNLGLRQSFLRLHVHPKTR